MAEKQHLLKSGAATSASAKGSINSSTTANLYGGTGGDPELVERTVEGNMAPHTPKGPSWWPFGTKRAAQPPAPRPKLRKVPVKVEPKVFFANERTFIAWMHMSVTLSSITIAVLAFADQNEWSEVYGLVMMPCAIFFVVYALHQYLSRAAKIRNRSPGPYDSLWGPVLLAALLAISVVVNFAIKMYELVY